ncbi:hypothetical protein KAK06_09250 [Ideonella sp. 4Y11]|uniref:Uncharacterized protein n=1 Tax=Ideonella aquatica TaxID=2824119 RepID=A0A940YI38_9BURK|nr:hypothetical protein [Ideonella aquatica]MBQ0959147.1 hypothetical protein [Ideonella aquatica]
MPSTDQSMAPSEDEQDECLSNEDPRLSGRLANWALGLWCLSLLLPAFQTREREPWLGAEVLMIGPFFGWASMGFAVYANAFFAHACTQLLKGGRPGSSVLWMLAMTATLPWFQGVLRDEGTGMVLAVTSWGWGAVLWVLSMLMLASASAVASGRLGPRGLRVLGGLGAVSLMGLLGVNAWQYWNANLPERQRDLALGLAFTLKPPCGVPLTLVEGHLVPANSALIVDVDPALDPEIKDRVHFALPAQLGAMHEGHAWRVVDWEDDSRMAFWQRLTPSADIPVVQVRAAQGGAVIRLLATAHGPVLYEQTLRTRPGFRGYMELCPFHSERLGHQYMTGPDEQLLRAVKPPKLPQDNHLRDETAATPCPKGKSDLYGLEDVRDWDGREVIAREWHDSKALLCSPSYVAKAQFWLRDGRLGAAVTVRDRRSLRQLARLDTEEPCVSMPCVRPPDDAITAVQIGDQVSTIYLPQQTVTVRRRSSGW